MRESLPFAIRHFWDDPLVTDVLVNDETQVWIERAGRLERTQDLRPGEISSALKNLLAPLGRRLDRLSPMVDARLADGTRICAVIDPVVASGTCVAFRIFRRTSFAIDDFRPTHATSDWATLEELLRTSDANIVITGPTGSGKSALLGAIAATSHREGRLVVLEDTRELVIDHPNAVRLEARDPTHEGRGEIGLDDLLRTALRLRPDRLIVGEVRGPEALTLIQALNTGHRRCLATLHANAAIDGLHRLDLLTMSGATGWTLEDARSLVDAAVGYVVHMERGEQGRRTVSHVARIDSTGRSIWLDFGRDNR